MTVVNPAKLRENRLERLWIGCESTEVGSDQNTIVSNSMQPACGLRSLFPFLVNLAGQKRVCRHFIHEMDARQSPKTLQEVRLH
jgi:hypothetical protein